MATTSLEVFPAASLLSGAEKIYISQNGAEAASTVDDVAYYIRRGPAAFRSRIPLFRWMSIRILATYTGTGSGPVGIAFDGTNMWTENYYAASVTKIAPDGTMTTYSGTGTAPNGIAFDGTNMWTANYSAASVTKIAPDGTMTTYTGTGAGPGGIAFDGTNMWTANQTDASVTKILVIVG